MQMQPHSGSQANASVFSHALKPGDKILVLTCLMVVTYHGSPVNFSGRCTTCFMVLRKKLDV
jgi:glycine hydroxymethyltransferase